MSKTTYIFKMDSNLKKAFDSICKEIGISSNTAITIFAETVAKERRIPFEIRSDSNLNSALITMRSE